MSRYQWLQSVVGRSHTHTSPLGLQDEKDFKIEVQRSRCFILYLAYIVERLHNMTWDVI